MTRAERLALSHFPVDTGDERAARELDDPRYARRHRLVVDTYCLQHPERYCAW